MTVSRNSNHKPEKCTVWQFFICWNLFHNHFLVTSPPRWVQSIMIMSVWLSACITRKPHGRTLPIFLCMLPVAAARSSSDGFAICYVLWMMSCFHTINQWARIKHSVMSGRSSPGWTLRQLWCLVEFIRMWRHWRLSLLSTIDLFLSELLAASELYQSTDDIIRHV